MSVSISWPASFPAPLQDGFSMQPEDRRIANSTVGTAFFSSFGGDVCTADCTILLSPSQSVQFEAFERDTLVHGTRWFSFPVWYAGEVHWEDCRFKSRPKAGSLVGKWTQYSFSLYVKRRTELMPDCMVKVFACYPPCFFPEFDKRMESLFSILQGVNTRTVADALSFTTISREA